MPESCQILIQCETFKPISHEERSLLATGSPTRVYRPLLLRPPIPPLTAAVALKVAAGA